VPKDEVEGYKWWLLAAAQGNQIARNNIAKEEPRMTRYEVIEGQRRARDFKPQQTSTELGDSL
jgi:hypothetical protein